MSDKYPATLLCDFYKVSHREQYPEGTEHVYSTWIPRESRIEGVQQVVAFGFQGFIQRYLIDYFNENFFHRDEQDVVQEYKHVIGHTLGVVPDATHLRDLHRLGYLPIEIKAVAEGTLVPLRVPMLTIENTDPHFFWLTNYLETLFSTETWLPCTSATLAFEFRKLLQEYAIETAGNADFVPFQGHDFSMRGLSSLEAAAASGAAHLLSFVGTDTIPGILYAERYYDADITDPDHLVGTSIPATEHSVMCAGGAENEYETYKRLITEVYPHGFVSIVSDTWDLWNTLGKIIPALKTEIMERDGRVVIRPDSGDPVAIICGDPSADPNSLAYEGVVETLWDIFGGTMTDTGYKLLDSHIGVIYGDAITRERADLISRRLKEKGFASTNMVYGVGSFTYQYKTRDTFGFALKATQVTINGQERAIFKDPKTDSGMKKSLTGRVVVLDSGESRLVAVDHLTREQQAIYAPVDLLKTVFYNGRLTDYQTFEDVRERLLSRLPSRPALVHEG